MLKLKVEQAGQVETGWNESDINLSSNYFQLMYTT
jgi:hypothetical protein